MIIKILGSGCPKCQKSEENAKKAVEESGLKDVRVEHIYDMDKVIELGVAMTPAIMFDDEIKAQGRIPEVEEIKGWLREAVN